MLRRVAPALALALMSPLSHARAASSTLGDWALPPAGSAAGRAPGPDTIRGPGPAALPEAPSFEARPVPGACAAGDCGADVQGPAASGRPALPGGALLLPLVTQETDYSCGPAALLSVLRYWRAFAGREQDLYGPLETTEKDGTEPHKLAEVARKLGLAAELRTGLGPGDLAAALERGETAILDIQAWREDGDSGPWEDEWEDGHYVVLVGLDGRNAYFMDPVLEGAYGYIPLHELARRWHDYEDRDGTVRRYFRLGVLIRGSAPSPRPAPPRKPPKRIK